MSRKKINVVWLKRDLRTTDHLPFLKAEESDLDYLIIFIFEPSIISHPDTSLRHLQFQYHSLKQMSQLRTKEKLQITICYGEAIDVFNALYETCEIQQLFSYRESGVQPTFDRDKQIKKWCVAHKIKWIEYQRDGILRGIENRLGWDKQWYTTMCRSTVNNQFKTDKTIKLGNVFTLPDNLKEQLEDYSKEFQPAGEQYAWSYLKSFVNGRGKNYHSLISKPTESRKSCGRISPYLAWGNLSVRQAFLYVKTHPNYDKNKRAFNGFLTRLKWRCHFIQKFEVECRYETYCVNSGYELLKRPLKQEFIEAWENGKTGFPLLDACMRCVKETGWINFRMRAMVVSLLCHHFDQDWRTGVYFLAKQFLDYEPGIHYPQFQMQAGTTGVNTIRMYNPVKQSQDHDPEGIFIKKWVPELRNIRVDYIHEPWNMTAMEQEFCGVKIGEDYPLPIVDLTVAGKIAREKIWRHRKHPDVRKEKIRIVELHTRNDQKKKK